jgi:DNA-binding XRE family transcriptional regulator
VYILDNIKFKKINVKDEKLKLLKKEPDLKEYFERADLEYQLIKKLVKIRKQKNITQKEISDKSGIKQQVISRIETFDSLPTLKTFLKYLDSMDLEIKIEEKKKIG